MNKPVPLVYAAMLTPWNAQGGVDYTEHDRILEFLLERGIDGIVIGGATGEYPHLEFADRAETISRTARALRGRAKLVASIGSSTLQGAVKLGEHAIASGCEALLLPMPHFYRYEQQDLKAFCESICRTLEAPCLLYNLPSFTSPLSLDTIRQLLRSEKNLVGIKDSSGIKENLQQLTAARVERPITLYIGDDALLLDALLAGWDGVVSGLACFAPELVRSLVREFAAGNLEGARRAQDHLLRLIGEILRLPVPWGVRAGLKARGLIEGHFPLPLSEARKAQIAGLREWISTWLGTVSKELN